ncbi:hypothetical protein ACTAB0_17990 [Pseudomonas syringae]|uniref:hypothetical protein n=1 Tax=Pseudomonas syringae TaxID=317 RepID=UPI003F7B2AD3
MKFKVKVYYNVQHHRALAIPEEKTLDDLPDEAKGWIGPQTKAEIKEFDTSEQLLGFNPPKVWEDFQSKGYSTFEVTATIQTKS